MEKEILTHDKLLHLATTLAYKIQKEFKSHTKPIKVYGIPRGGVCASYLLSSIYSQLLIVDEPEKADLLIDDIIDSGKTLWTWVNNFPRKPFYCLIDKTNPKDSYYNRWVVFPWEGDVESSIEDNIIRLLQFIGEDPSRQGLQETPKRVAKAWQHWSSGYSKNPEDILKSFEDGADGCDEMVIVKDIPFYSKCEHHLASFFGTASVTYIPDGKIVGLSKISRIVDMYACRLQVQERLTNQIADALNNNLQPKGVGVVVKARHLCMESRGICQQGHSTITSALRGVLKENASARAEFLELIK